MKQELLISRRPGACLAMLVALVFFALGCTEQTAQRVTVMGKVNVGGKPLTGGTLLLKSQNTKFPIKIAIDGKGQFISWNVPPDTYMVGVETESVKSRVQQLKEEAADGAGDVDSENQETLERAKLLKYVPIAQKYNNPEKSGLTWTITAGKNEKDFNLEAK